MLLIGGLAVTAVYLPDERADQLAARSTPIRTNLNQLGFYQFIEVHGTPTGSRTGFSENDGQFQADHYLMMRRFYLKRNKKPRITGGWKAKTFILVKAESVRAAKTFAWKQTMSPSLTRAINKPILQ